MSQIKRLILSLFLIASVIIGTTSCGSTRAVLVPPGDLIRIGPDVEGRIYLWDGSQWVPSADDTGSGGGGGGIEEGDAIAFAIALGS